MPYCPDCGVEIGTAAVCPLCGLPNLRAAPVGPVQSASTAGEFSGEPPPLRRFFEESEALEALSAREKRKVAWEVISVAFAISVLALALINLLLEARLSWSLYPVASLFYVWILASCSLLMEAKPRLRLFLAALATPLFLIALGFFTGSPGWALRLALPLAIFTELTLAGIVLAARNTRRQGLNIFAYIAIGAALVCLATEIFVDLFVHDAIHLGWSMVTTISLLPIAAFFTYLHYRVARETNLRRLFKL
jgi:hypothetical protein